MEFFDVMISRNESMGLILLGIAFILIGVYWYIDAIRNRMEDMSFVPVFMMIAGLVITGFTAFNSLRLTNYTTDKENTLISINAEDTDNKKVIMKFKESDNSIKEIKAPVKEKFTKDKKKHNKYSLKEIKDGYVIYYIAENVDIPSNPTLKYFNGTKPLKNVVEE